MISAENVDFKNSIEQQYLWLEQQGFEVVERKERQGVNPSTGEKITIPASKALKFKASKTLKDSIK